MQPNGSDHLSLRNKFLLPALIGAAIIAMFTFSCGPTAYSVEHVEIDSTLHIHPIGVRSMSEPSRGSSYFFSNASQGLTVEHYAERRGAERPEQLLYLEAHPDSVLDRTVKKDEIVKGTFGTLYSTKECFYNSPLERGYSSVSDASGGNDAQHEVPVEVDAAPSNLPPLTSFSLTRVFRAEPEYAVVTANYEPDGKLGSLHVNKAQGGDSAGGENSTFGLLLQYAPIATYGIPLSMGIQEYLASKRLKIAATELEDVEDVAVVHYGYNQIIRQDTLSHGVVITSRFLQPSVTPEEKI